jgi:hypothetical protein
MGAAHVQHSADAAEGRAMSDAINPDHYKQGGIECIEAMKASMTREQFQGYLKGQVIKYLWRLGLKDSAVQDALKAAWYLDRMIMELADER